MEQEIAYLHYSSMAEEVQLQRTAEALDRLDPELAKNFRRVTELEVNDEL